MISWLSSELRWLWMLCGAILAIGFGLDLLVPLGIAVGFLYLTAVLGAMWLPGRAAPLAMAAAGTVLTAVGYVLSPPPSLSLVDALSNRGILVAALWAVAAALFLRGGAQRASDDTAKSLRRAQEIAHFGDYELDLASGQLRWSDEVFRIMARDPAAGAPMLVEYLDEIVHPDDRAAVARTLRRIRKEGGEFDHEHRIVRPDGSLRYVHSIGGIIKDREVGAAPRVVGMLFDITARKTAEEALKERERRLESIIETAPEGVITIDESGTVESFSSAAEQLFGYTADEVIGRNVSMLMPSPDRERHDDYLVRYLRTGERRIIGIGRVVQGLRKDGTVFPLELAVGEVALSSQRIFTGFVRDVTYRHRMEQELHQAQKMEAIGQLTGGIAHDFNNLLTVITGNLEMLEARIADEKQREILHEAREAADLGGQLTGRLLAFGRRQPLAPQRVDLGDIVHGMKDMLHRTLGEAIEVETRLASGLPPCVVDPGQIENVILNLAINARDAMPQGGRLTIETEEVELDAAYATQYPEVRQGHYVRLSVTDTGIGMSRETQEKAFEPFFTTKETGSGTGLGLSMAYGFVKQSNGHIRLYSEPGHGTTISIYLPKASETADADQTRGPAATDESGKGETILVVEDDARVRRVSIERLYELGYKVVEAADGREALALLENGLEVDLLFTDMVMPGGITGDMLAEQARTRAPDIKVLFTSGYAEPDVVTRSVVAGAGWLRKPYTKSALAAKVRGLLDA